MSIETAFHVTAPGRLAMDAEPPEPFAEADGVHVAGIDREMHAAESCVARFTGRGVHQHPADALGSMRRIGRDREDAEALRAVVRRWRARCRRGTPPRP